jgi:hypothetical protein
MHLHGTVLCPVIFHRIISLVKEMEGTKTSRASISVILSMLGGIFVVFGGLMLLAMLGWYGTTLMMGGQMHTYTFAYPRWLTLVVGGISILFGGLVMSASYKMYGQPGNKLWPLLIVIGSIVSLFSIGGLGLGAVLGLIGGAIGLGRKSQEA